MPDPVAVRHSRLRAAGRVLALGVAVLAAVPLVTGWLYWLRAPLTAALGSQLRDALPLDELPAHDGVPLLGFLVVAGAASVLAGAAARAAGLYRLESAVLLTVGVGACWFGYLSFCLFVVRQGTPHAAMSDAARVPALYVAALLAGVSGALLARPRPAGVRPSRLLAWLVAGSGVLSVIGAVVPHAGERWDTLFDIAPSTGPPAASALVVPAGVLLVVASRGLRRGSRAAALLCVGLLGGSAVLNLVRGSAYLSAGVAAVLALAVVAGRSQFTAGPEPARRRSAPVKVATLLAVAFGYGVVALLVNRAASGLPLRFGDAIATAVRALIGQKPDDSRYLVGDFATWFPWSVMGIAAVGVIWAAAGLIAPWRNRLTGDSDRDRRAIAIVRRWGTDPLAPFALRADKDRFLLPAHTTAADDGTLIAYRVVRGVAVVSGDPIGPPEARAAAFDQFVVHAHHRGWRVAVLGAGEGFADEYRARGMTVLYHGDEAVLDVAEFSLAGRDMRAVRQAANRVDRAGYRGEICREGALTPRARQQLDSLERTWLRGRRRTGFTMEAAGLFDLTGDDAVFVIARDPAGEPVAFLHLAACPAARTLSLSSMPRRTDTPNGLNAWLIVRAVEWAGTNGYAHLSLNFSPFSRFLVERIDDSVVGRLRRGALQYAKGRLGLQLDNLYRFNAQFGPRFVPRFFACETGADLPAAAFAAMAAEGYLPFADVVRGRHWLGHTEDERAA